MKKVLLVAALALAAASLASSADAKGVKRAPAAQTQASGEVAGCETGTICNTRCATNWRRNFSSERACQLDWGPRNVARNAELRRVGYKGPINGKTP